MNRRSFLKAALAGGGTVCLRPPDAIPPSPRALRLSLSDTIDLRDYLDGSGAPGTEVKNSAAFAALLSDLNSRPGPVTVKGRKGDVYRIGGATTKTFTGSGRLQMDGGSFHWTGNLRGGSFLLDFEDGWDVSGLEFVALDGSNFRRLIRFRGGDRGHRINDNTVYAESQIRNSHGLLDYAVQFHRSNQSVRRFKVENIDKAILAYGSDGDQMPGTHNHFEGIEVVSYVTGFELRNVTECRNVGYRCRGRSPNATQDPGHNGLLHSGVAHYSLSDYEIRDAGEHGCRFGGTRYAEQTSKDITVARGRIVRSGQSGLKFFTGAPNQRFTDVSVRDVEVIDCQYEPENQSELPGFNDEAFLLQQIERGAFHGLSAFHRDNPTGFSCDCVVFISGANQLKIDGIKGSKPRRNFLRISEWDDGAGGNPVETLANYGISIQNAYGSAIGEDGFFIDHPSKPLRMANISVQMEGTNSPGHFAVMINSNSSLLAGDSVIKYQARNFQGGQVFVPTSEMPLMTIGRN